MTSDKDRLDMIKKAVAAQAEDESIWFNAKYIGESYLQRCLRQLHRVIEHGDAEALADIIQRAELSKGEK